MTKPYMHSVLAAACALGLATAMPLAANEFERTDLAEDAIDAREQLADAHRVLQEMRAEAQLGALLNQAPAVFIAPDYGRAALGVGVRGGEGVLLLNRNGRWTDPMFYNFGGISFGVQAGVEAGAIAMILNNQRALDSFMQKNNWSLNADAGLTVVNWSARAQASAGKGDVIVWSDAAGLFGDLAISVTDIRFDEEETAAFYGTPRVTRHDIFIGVVEVPEPVAEIDEE